MRSRTFSISWITTSQISSNVRYGIKSHRGYSQRVVRPLSAHLVGGETAEHPGSFPENSFDLAGFSLGVVDENEMIGVDGPRELNDVLIGIESSGFHSNGFLPI